MRWGRVPGAVLLAVLLLIAGCGGTPKGEISGTVKYDGALVEKGQISFYPIDGEGQTAGGPITDGHYSVSNLSVGKMRVVITWFKTGGDLKREGPTAQKITQLIPAKYSDPDKSELQYEVTKGANQKDFDLTK
jgi:hypothetical protein